LKTPYHTSCTIIRTKKVLTHHVNWFTGQDTGPPDADIRTEACGTPLFHEREHSTGICESCRRGWQVGDNRFASSEEKRRATTDN
jgi:hypothetical protein